MLQAAIPPGDEDVWDILNSVDGDIGLFEACHPLSRQRRPLVPTCRAVDRQLYRLPFAWLWVLQSNWQLLAEESPPLLHAEM